MNNQPRPTQLATVYLRSGQSFTLLVEEFTTYRDRLTGGFTRYEVKAAEDAEARLLTLDLAAVEAITVADVDAAPVPAEYGEA